MLSFDDFKKQQEVFGPITTPKKLAFCKQQYERYVLNYDNNKHFEPYQYNTRDEQLLQYEQNLHTLLPFDTINDQQLALLVRPSFTPESLLIIDRQEDHYTLTYTILNSNYWSAFYNNNTTGIHQTTQTATLPNTIGDHLFAIIDTAMTAARIPVKVFHTMDGVTYIFSRLINNQLVSVFKHSPNEGSQTANIISVFEHLIKYIDNLNNDTIQKLEALLHVCVPYKQ